MKTSLNKMAQRYSSILFYFILFYSINVTSFMYKLSKKITQNEIVKKKRYFYIKMDGSVSFWSENAWRLKYKVYRLHYFMHIFYRCACLLFFSIEFSNVFRQLNRILMNGRYCIRRGWSRSSQWWISWCVHRCHCSHLKYIFE